VSEGAGDTARALRELVGVLQLEKAARELRSTEELAFLIVNDTRRAIPYAQAVLLCGSPGGKLAPLHVSGVSSPATDAPWMQSLARVINLNRSLLAGADPVVLSPAVIDESARADWDAVGARTALWVPLHDHGGALFAGLWLSRDLDWRQAEVMQLGFLGNAFAHAWCALQDRSRPLTRAREWLHASVRERRSPLYVALAIMLLLLLPVRQSVVAPAQVAARSPFIVSPPVDGVIERIHVQPNEMVEAQQLLFSLDERALRNRHEVALKALAVAQADLARAVQKAFSDPQSKAEIKVLQAVVEQKNAEVAYTVSLLERIQVRAPAAGMVLFSDPHDWLGRPVGVGEKIMTIADAADVELLVWLPVDEAINLEPGARIDAFLNIEPTRTLRASLRVASYTAEPSPQDVLAYRVRAALDGDSELPRIGLQATAKLHGARVTLFYYLFRRPMAHLRRLAGW
jgi:hypothetical protein